MIGCSVPSMRRRANSFGSKRPTPASWACRSRTRSMARSTSRSSRAGASTRNASRTHWRPRIISVLRITCRKAASSGCSPSRSNCRKQYPGRCKRRPGHFLRLRCSHHRRRIFRYVHAAFAARQARPERHRIEAGDGGGGTWYWNRYPGARCDSDSYVYCYTFDKNLLQEWDWSERYPEQDEILRYLEHCAERFDLKPDIQFGKRVVEVVFDDNTELWTVRTDRGDVVRARFIIAAVGALSAAKLSSSPPAST